MQLSFVIVDFHLFFDRYVDVKVWAILTRSRCRVFNTQVTVACKNLLFNFYYWTKAWPFVWTNLKLESPSPKNVLWQIMGCHYYWQLLLSGHRYIYFLENFVFSHENCMISSLLSVLSCYISCIANTFQINGI